MYNPHPYPLHHQGLTADTGLFQLTHFTWYCILVPRVLSYPPYGGRVGENPGNEVDGIDHCIIGS